jgi:hypothetical protein
MFNFNTLGDIFSQFRKKPGANQAPQEVKTPEPVLVDSGAIVVKPAKKVAKPRKKKNETN